MTWFQALVLAVLQGVTELFPISSLGHTILLTARFGWGELESSPSFLPYIVPFHVATATALAIYFWRRWLAIVRVFVATTISGRLDSDPNGRLAWLLIAGTVPAGLIGLFLEAPLKQLFASPTIAAIFMVVNGVILLIGERVRRRALPSQDDEEQLLTVTYDASHRRTVVLDRPPAPASAQTRPFASLSVPQAILVGLSQALALIPGLSRSGMTMVAALRVGMSHEDAAEYTFLLATPIIAAAGVLERPQLGGTPPSTLVIALSGGVVAGVSAYPSTRVLTHHFETGRLDPFGYYCIAVGLLATALIVFHR
jgi:undecaprenyl-diphosphatase